MYHERADLYDRIYRWKDYAAETSRVRAILSAAGVPDGGRVVEAACGTGNYLVQLQKHYAVEGFDINGGILGAALSKLPGVRLFRADMSDFTLARPADALLCLFGSIGYVAPGAPLARTAACFFRALRPGGVALVEAWITPDESKPGHVSVQTYDGEKSEPPEAMKVVRVATHLVEGRKSVLDFHWLVATPTGVEHFSDRHELWQSTEKELLDVFRGAGFEARWLHPGPITGRGVILARRPD